MRAGASGRRWARRGLLAWALAATAAGCAGRAVALGPGLWPLERVAEDRLLAIGTAARTIGTTVYVADLDAFLAVPEPWFTADLRHEQLHARRQLELGTWRYILGYLFQPGFMWQEEQLGYRATIAHLRRSCGGALPAWMVPRLEEALVRSLLGYWNAGGNMVSEEAARRWVRAELGDGR